ncbi:alpha-1,4-glucan--maltose-1-phosphate maltosyltransferase [Longibacter salinarum]|uniref:Alpha-1,4-glucan:maltose-1-phosphate maltosyltransferase n=1 Tax=Longibacter salinarum TaxID=1850348 RepID=A0A2A8D103_9BACT|nr:maltotransferase domain-containing protein [Longibacter salinarum]PEN14642.1 alpha-1,4-glucan--maltose-1-phosphate maltosyltransferase [Longibacter salinarum]
MTPPPSSSSTSADAAVTGTPEPVDAPAGTTAPDDSTLPKKWSRIMIPFVRPSIEGGIWPIKRSVDESVDVRAGVVVDSHEAIEVELVVTDPEGETTIHRMTPEENDEYSGRFEVTELGRYAYTVRAWLNRFATWQDQFRRRVAGGEPHEELESELQAGVDLVRAAMENADGTDAKKLKADLEAFEAGDEEAAMGEGIAARVRRNAPHDMMVESQTYEVIVDPKIARSGAWYEFFPRSTRDDGKHGTLDDAAERLEGIRDMGFDVVYLPPIHPIGVQHRKGKDNAPTAEPGDPGSPWAIGGLLEDGTKGGHKSVHPDLGGMEAFDRFVEKAEDVGLKVAIDIAFQTSPDHPYVEDHPEWFHHRPDGSIRYAENPPKKYQDVYPINFENEDWPALWTELQDVFQFWIDRGVTIFRVDNPHTKPFAFWEWCLAELRKDTPELIVLSEAFTKPKTMYGLAKLGFNNSYTYFTWRNTKDELTGYAKELFHTDVAEYFRPNFWPNTPDILHDFLVHGGRAAHQLRFVLAATLSSAYGVYGPPYEHVFNHQHPDREEYAKNEKYEIRTWNWDDPMSLQDFMGRVNAIRKDNPALQQMRSIRFHETKNPNLIAYSKKSGDNLIVVVVNLDPHNPQEGQLDLDNGALGLPHDDAFIANDLLNDTRYTWRGQHHYVRLSPDRPAHIFRLEQEGQEHEVFERPVHD